MIQVELSPETEARLSDEAHARGVPAESYARTLIEQGVCVTPRPPAHKLTVAEMEAFLTAMTSNSDKIPQLPDEAFTRESFYQDHD